ncbi:flavin mononucleotide phosphatase [Photorhabdus luminescens]|uniref:Flavin mononucleotide phosphatase n=1 Tax=Photorhabdus akhurstii TaxID=171438 RepID=A0ABX8LZT7_9GAMM|nr:5-amino-6-(5-phospho-D-ribitylamino)uracil phosphatase YigB [Photorhabdus akhurstii]PQQ29477.1 5-amino-6-(5-phospho-D-ribitylamino)uracil phosphatase YigB [Photorhabdus luminescens]QXF35821.1 flavin mononucleotide phosphatase [Photorhabdus akhurstii]UJD77653.1 flavin mononucleotide phosphatase [Photorhabdus luminescens]
MRFYRPLAPVLAMTFDLDDTLYDNHPVMDKTEEEVLNFVRQYDPRFSHLNYQDLYAFRELTLEQYPEIYHDMTLWRWHCSRLMFCHYGFSGEDADRGADDVMAHFTLWRNRIDIPESTHKTLAALAEQMPLVAITNGNAEPAACGLAPYFKFVLKAGPDGRSKPCSDMYRLAADRLDLPLGQILHVGDDLNADVAGALRSGMQACWINTKNKKLLQTAESRLLPHIEIYNLASLTALI